MCREFECFHGPGTAKEVLEFGFVPAGIPQKLLCESADRVPDVPRADKVKYGEYLAGPVGHCTECHTPMVDGRRDWSRLGQGGEKFEGPWGIAVSRNLTPHPEDGLGKWTDAEIKRAITQGVSKNGAKLFPPMGYSFYAKVKDEDLDAIVAYLRSLKPLPRAN